MSYQSAVLGDNPTGFWLADTLLGDNTLVDSSPNMTHLVLQGVSGTDYVGGVSPVLRDVNTSTTVNTRGALGTAITNFGTTEFSFEIWWKNLLTPPEAVPTYLFDYWTTGGQELSIYLLASGNFLYLYTVFNGGATIAVSYLGTLADLCESSNQTYLEVSWKGTSVRTIVNAGTPLEVSAPATPLGTDGIYVLGTDQSAYGVPGSEGLSADIGGIALYDYQLNTFQVLQHALAGDQAPYLTLTPDAGSFNLCDQYWSLSVDPGVGTISQLNIVADYDGLNETIYNSTLGWGEGWTGDINTVGDEHVYSFRAIEAYYRNTLTIFAACTTSAGHTTDIEKGYTLKGELEYPLYMKPTWQSLIDEDGNPIVCT